MKSHELKLAYANLLEQLKDLHRGNMADSQMYTEQQAYRLAEWSEGRADAFALAATLLEAYIGDYV